MNRSQGRVDMKKVEFLGEIAVSSLAMAIVSIAYATPARAQDQAPTAAAGMDAAGEGAGQISETGPGRERTRFNSPHPAHGLGHPRADTRHTTNPPHRPHPQP